MVLSRVSEDARGKDAAGTRAELWTPMNPETAAYEAFVKHWKECDKCWHWHCALPGSKLCGVGDKLYAMLVKMTA